jgi:cytochrome c553
MSIQRPNLTVLITAAAVLLALLQQADAQAPAKGPATAAKAKATTARPAALPATLAQLMKGIFFPSSNVIFLAQSQNPAEVPPDKDPPSAVNPLASSYGKWEAVENSSLAIAEASRLLTVPGRKCSNGRNVPLTNADWNKFVQGLRDAAMKSYKAAQSKNQDNILDAADALTTACANCHDKYREKEKLEDRCM